MHLPYLYGPGMTLRPTRVWLAEVRAIRAVAGAVREERPPEQEWMPAKKAVERAKREGVAITLPTVSKWRVGGKLGFKTRARTLPGRHHWEVDYNSLVLVCHQNAVTPSGVEPFEGSFEERIRRAKAADVRRLG
jgi:hypothetical protein